MSRVRQFPYWIESITLLGFILYLARSLYFAHSALSIGDEGAYLFKGLMFARGDFVPFQDYGLWTNKAPLAFLIPGYIQLLFGAGLREARYFAVLVSALVLVGLWIVSVRMGGKVWGAVAVWVFALSDANTSIYSQALSQGLVACMFSWFLVCILGEKRPWWQLILGSILSVLIVMTRQNMVVLLPCFIGYIFWQYGRKMGWWVLGTCTALFVLFHALYWPNILQLWAPWLPDSLTPFLNEFRPFAEFGYDDWIVSDLSRIQSVSIGIQHHFFILCGFVAGVILFPPKSKWKNASHFTAAVFLGAAFFTLFLMHTWGSLFNKFCVQCFSPYLMFYTTTGFLFIVVVFSNGVRESTVRRILLLVALLVFAAGLGSYYFQRLGAWSLDAIKIPRANRIFSDGEFAWASLGDVFTYVLGYPADIQKRLGSALTGILIGLSLFVLVWAFRRFIQRENWFGFSSTLTSLHLFLIVGVVLPPAVNLGVYSTPCSTNFLSYYEEAGLSLANTIPPGSLIYWKGSGRHIGLILYLDDARIFPPQITAGAGYVKAGDAERLLRFGMFDDAMDLQWRESADFFIIWDGYPNTELGDFEDDERYEAVSFDMKNLAQCEDVLHLFRRRS